MFLTETANNFRLGLSIFYPCMNIYSNVTIMYFLAEQIVDFDGSIEVQLNIKSWDGRQSDKKTFLV